MRQSPARHDTNAGMGVGKFSVLACQQDIAHQGQLKAARNRKAINGTDDRPRISAQCAGNIDIPAINAKRKASFTCFFQIDTSGEGAPRSGQHNCADALVACKRIKCIDEVCAQLAV